MYTRKEAIAEFNESILPLVIEQYSADDEPAINEAFNNFTDSLCKEGTISDLQYNYWLHPDSEQSDDEYELIFDSLNLYFEFKFIPASQCKNDDEYEWINHKVIITRGKSKIEVDYRQGIGQLPFSVTGPRTIDLDKRIKHALETGKHGLNRKLASPDKEDIIYSILMDSNNSDDEFSEWCDNFGFNCDSIKALDIYKSCQECARKLRKMFTPKEIDGLNELFEDF